MNIKFPILFLAIITLSACASDINEAKRLETCIIDGNINNNCELKTLENGQ